MIRIYRLTAAENPILLTLAHIDSVQMNWSDLPPETQSKFYARISRPWTHSGKADQTWPGHDTHRNRSSQSSQILKRLAEAHFRQMNIAEASKLYELVLTRNPSDPDAIERLGRIAIHMKQWDRASHMLLQVIRQDPCNNNAAEAILVLARRQVAHARSSRALELLEAALLQLSTCEDANGDSILLIAKMREDVMERIAKEESLGPTGASSN